MATVLDEVTTMSIDAPYVQRRVDDWICRLSSLYGVVKRKRYPD